jgi:anti-sigma regulatory factor (Ser/Thr protein kinase)
MTMPAPDEITLTLPRDREFHRIAHLVLGGLALRLELTIETLEDLQLALSAILDRAGAEGEVTVSMTLNGDMIETRVGPIDLGDELTRDEEGLGLRRILWTVVDDVQVDGDYVRLLKRVEPRDAGG